MFDSNNKDFQETPDIQAEVGALIHTADRLREHFESVLIICSTVVNGRSVWFTVERGNEFANETLSRRYVRGELSAPPPEGGLHGVSVPIQ